MGKELIREEIKEDLEGMREYVKEDIANAKKDLKDAKVKFTSKMSSKVAYLVLAAIIVPIVLLIVISIKKTTATMKDTYMSYALNLAEEAANGIDFAVDLGENTYGTYALDLARQAAKRVDAMDVSSASTITKETATTVETVDTTATETAIATSTDATADTTTTDTTADATAEAETEITEYVDYSSALADISIDGVEGSYAYMVSPTGTMLYHKSAEKIGQPVENAAVKGIVADLSAGKKVEDGYVLYEYKGATKLAGYSFTESGDIVIVTADYDAFMRIDYDTLIGKIEITGVEGSYAYMVSPDGTMLYHKNAEKIGQPVENAAVKGIVEDLAAGKTVENDAVVYEYKGEDKLAGYAFTSKGNIVVVTADYKTFIKPITKQKNALITISIIMIITLSIIGLIVVSTMMKAVENIVPSIRKTANFDFTHDEMIIKMCSRKDEIGVIAREISAMEENLRKVVGTIGDATDNIDTNVDMLQTISLRVNDMCEDNSRTSESLAAGMEETSASTVSITENINNMQQEAKGIERLTVEGADRSVEVMGRATNLRSTTEIATKNTMATYSDVKEKSKIAIEAADAVNKINELTENVMNISAQTSLLALNASIEAARAGEAGRGFAVVASEISSLADQTKETVNSINAIVYEVNGAVGNMTECLKETVEFLEKNVIEDYNNFEKVGIQYQKDADIFKACMENIKEGIVELNNNLEHITQSIGEISNTMGEATEGVSDIAGKTIDMVGETTETTNKVEDCKRYVANLNSIIDTFSL